MEAVEGGEREILGDMPHSGPTGTIDGGHAVPKPDPCHSPYASDIEVRLESQLGLPLAVATRISWRLAIVLCRGNEEDAKDVVQDVMVRITRRVVHGPPLTVRLPEAWIYAATKNVFLDGRRRANAVQRGGNQPVDPIDAMREPVAPGRGPEDLVVDADLNAWLMSAIESLGPDHKQVMTMLVVDGKRPSEIADLLGIPRATVRSRIQSARAAMRSYLQRVGWEMN